MDLESAVGSVPRRLEVGSASYELAGDLVAMHGAEPDPAAVMAVDGISVQPVASVGADRLEGARAGPVYRQRPGDGLAVPSGRLFVRFAAGDSAWSHEAEMAAAGLEIESVLSHAPHAAWLRPVGGGVAEALQALERVTQVEAVEHAEPQLLMPVGRRT